MSACMQVVSDVGFMRVGFSVHCMQEMPLKRHVLVQVPDNAATH